MAKLALSNPHGYYTLDEGMIKFQGKIWLGNNTVLQHKVLKALHASSLGGHSGFPATYKRVSGIFHWPGMKKQTLAWVQSCQICQQAKPSRVKYPGLLQPLPVPPMSWHTITMDFISGLPTSGRFDCILVVVDKFTKYAHFLPLRHPITAEDVATTFVNNVYKLHGMPDIIVSDRDPLFTSKFWRKVWSLIGTDLNMSTANHPQSDGQTERVNQCLEIFLRCFVHATPKKWSEWLALAEYWYNTTVHSATGFSPCHVLYGYKPRIWGIEAADSTSVSDVDSWLQERRLINELVKQHLNRANQIMKHQADKNRTDCSFQVGDSVFLKLQPYAQSSVTKRASHKLSFKYFGPYQVLARVGQVAYQLKLPETSQVHPVFHISQLCRAIPEKGHVFVVLPSDANLYASPVQLLATRWVHRGNQTVEQGLIHWSGMMSEEDTWEDLQELQTRFPGSPAWGQARFQGEGIVSNPSPTHGPEAHEDKLQPKRIPKPNPRYYDPAWIGQR